MCGIFCAISSRQPVWPTAELLGLLQSRGPDSCGQRQSSVARRGPPRADGTTPPPPTAPPRAHLTFCATVLSMRGDAPVPQPLQGGHPASTFCWNGEAWTIGGQVTRGNDTAAAWRLLLEATKPSAAGPDSDGVVACDAWFRARRVARHLLQISGPYAFVFHDAALDLLFLGRDFLGRRSLLVNVTAHGDVLVSSVTDAPATGTWREIDADGLYCIDLQPDHGVSDAAADQEAWGPYRVLRVPYDAPSETNSADSITPVGRFILTVIPMRAWAHGKELLRQSLQLRILGIPDPPDPIGGGEAVARPSRLAILFSGGLDCTVLARLCHDLFPADEGIDLLNVAFENPRVHRHRADHGAAYELCPDRVTGRASHAELQRVCPGRRWTFVAIDVPYTETVAHRPTVVRLMHPHNTEMDLSISYALYFAARGAGGIATSSGTDAEAYTTPARVLLSGLGADELFGGYQRHATAYGRHGIAGLLDELDLDISRLGKRNLGRDDRVISHWGREARFPYLDESVLAWALAAPVTDKCGFGEPTFGKADDDDNDDGAGLEPSKKVLRCLAWKLGMGDVAREKKRAIQFGARTAKMETGKTKGTQALS